MKTFVLGLVVVLCLAIALVEAKKSGVRITSQKDTNTKFVPKLENGVDDVAAAAAGISDDCLLRSFTVNYTRSIQSKYSTQSWTAAAYEALRLGPLCNISSKVFTSSDKTPIAQNVDQANCGMIIYVDGKNGKNSNNGSASFPVQTVPYAVGLSRQRDSSVTTACVLVLEGDYYLGATTPATFGSKFESRLGAISLTAIDSGLTISAYKSAAVTFSGGRILDLKWSVYRETKAGVIMQATLPTDMDISQRHFNELYIDGVRAVRAKYPNGDPSTHGLYSKPTGWVDAGAPKWLPPVPFANATEIHVASPVQDDQHFSQFQLGIGGAAIPWNPPHSFWALQNPPGGGGSTYTIPSGLVWDANFSPRVDTWSDPSTGFIYAFHDGYWGSWVFSINTTDVVNNTITFLEGGFQEARGSLNGGVYYVDNIFEELDTPNEWFVDVKKGIIYFMPNVTMPKLFVASQLPCIVSVHADSSFPAVGITISGITFSHTSRTLMFDYEVPSAGDWAVHRGGSVFLTGTQSATISNCIFTQLGGNAVVISDWNVDAVVTDNIMHWLGESGVIIIGSADGIDGISNNMQPVNTRVVNSLIYNVGIYVKQTAGIAQFVSRSSVFSKNAIFNCPRAGINLNDGFAGGNEISENVIFNAVRETSDHGPINSWDRLVFLTLQPTGPGGSNIPTLVPANNSIHHNLLFNSYNSIWPIDHDDGSRYYEDYANVLIYGGYKMYLGHSHNVHDTLYIYPDGTRFDQIHPQLVEAHSRISKYNSPIDRTENQNWGQYCAEIFDPALGDSGWDIFYYNNVCALQSNNQPYAFDSCVFGGFANLVPYLAGNTYYLPPGSEINVLCSFQNGTQGLFSLAQFKSIGETDVGTAQYVNPGTSYLLRLADKILSA